MLFLQWLRRVIASVLTFEDRLLVALVFLVAFATPAPMTPWLLHAADPASRPVATP